MSIAGGAYSAEKIDHRGRSGVILRSPAGLEAVFLPVVGMLGCSLRHEGEELLHPRRGLDAYEQSGSTLGIPFLHPWANRLSKFDFVVGDRQVELDPQSSVVRTEEHGLPIHGLLAASPLWDPVTWSADASGARLQAEFVFDRVPELLAGFPFPHSIRIAVTLHDDGLTVSTTVSAADVPVPVAFGFHPYLRLPGSPRTEWTVSVPPCRRLRLDDRGIPDGDSEPLPSLRNPSENGASTTVSSTSPSRPGSWWPTTVAA